MLIISCGTMSKKGKNSHSNSSTMEIRLATRKALRSNLSEQARTGLLDRRSGLDRRGWGNMPAVPFTDSNGRIVKSDRRAMPERRMSSLQVNWEDSTSSSSEDATASAIQNEKEIPYAVLTNPEEGIETSDTDLQHDLEALAENIDDMLGLESADIMDDTELDYSKPKSKDGET
jgi:hypothetical protein